METETLRLLADAVDAVRAAAQATKNHTVDDLCCSAEHALRAAVVLCVDPPPIQREPTVEDLARMIRAQNGIA